MKSTDRNNAPEGEIQLKTGAQNPFETIDENAEFSLEESQTAIALSDSAKKNAEFAKAQAESEKKLSDVIVKDAILAQKTAEEALKVAEIARKNAKLAEERYKLVLWGSNDGIWDWDITKDTVHWNGRFFQMIGHAETDLIPSLEAFFKFIHPDDQLKIRETLQSALTHNKHFEESFRIRNIQGNYLYCDFRGKTIFNEFGQPIRMAGTITDITERIKKDEALQKSLERESLLKGIIGIINQSFDLRRGVEEITTELGTFLNVDRCLIIRLQEEDAVYQVDLMAQYYRPDGGFPIQKEDFPAPLFQLLNSHFKESLSYVIEDTANDHELPEPVKSYFHHQQVQSVIFANIQYQGKLYGYITLHQCLSLRHWELEEVALLEVIATHLGIAFYQSELFQQNKQTAQRETHIRQIIQTLHGNLDLDITFQELVNNLGRYLEADRCFISRYDSEQNELLPPIKEYRSSEDIENLLTPHPELWKTLSYFAKECCSQNEPIDFSSLTQGVSAEARAELEKIGIASGIGCSISYQRDCLAVLFIHQVKHKRTWSPEEQIIIQVVAAHAAISIHQSRLYEMEKASKILAETTTQQKSQMLAFVSHDFKNPLNAIIGYSNMLEQGFGGELTETQQKYIHNIGLSGQHLLEMVTGILDLARIEAGKLTLKIEKIELKPFLQDIEALMAPSTSSKNIVIHDYIAPGLTHINVDPKYFRQILLNLISNAIKYNKENGSVYIRFNLDRAGQMIVCSIEDTGIGISKENLPQLFTEYYRVKSGTKSKEEGLGLGLAFIKKLTELHHGTIKVESEIGKGSTFTIRLPNPLKNDSKGS